MIYLFLVILGIVLIVFSLATDRKKTTTWKNTIGQSTFIR